MSYPITVNKMIEFLKQVKASGFGESFVVTADDGGEPMPISAIECAAAGARERWGDYIMSERETNRQPDDVPRVIVIRSPRIVTVHWLSRELSLPFTK